MPGAGPAIQAARRLAVRREGRATPPRPRPGVHAGGLPLAVRGPGRPPRRSRGAGPAAGLAAPRPQEQEVPRADPVPAAVDGGAGRAPGLPPSPVGDPAHGAGLPASHPARRALVPPIRVAGRARRPRVAPERPRLRHAALPGRLPAVRRGGGLGRRGEGAALRLHLRPGPHLPLVPWPVGRRAVQEAGRGPVRPGPDRGQVPGPPVDAGHQHPAPARRHLPRADGPAQGRDRAAVAGPMPPRR